MNKTILRELLLPQSPDLVWQALTHPDTLAEWMFPNDFQPRVGHRFTFRVPPDPARKFEGIVVHCEVLECDPPARLVFSWSAGGPVTDTRVSYRLQPEGQGTRLFFEHSNFDFNHPWAEQAFRGAEYGWAKMHKQLAATLAAATPNTPSPTQGPTNQHD